MLDTLAHNASGTFYVTPTNKFIFPWLAPLAQGYEKYKFRRLNFFYRSTAPTTASGLIYMAMDYDPADADTNEITPRSLT